MPTKKSTSKKADGEMVIAHDESKAKKPEEPKLTGVEAYLAEEDPGSLPIETEVEPPSEPEPQIVKPEPAEKPTEPEEPGIKPPSKRKKVDPVNPKDIPEPLPPSAFVPGADADDMIDPADAESQHPKVVVPGGVAPSVPNPASFFRSHYKSKQQAAATVLGMSPQTIVYSDPQAEQKSALTAQSMARHESNKRLIIIILVTIISLIAFGVALYYWVYVPTQYFEG